MSIGVLVRLKPIIITMSVGVLAWVIICTYYII